MRKGQIKNVSYLTSTRRDLRNNATPAEVALWEMLRGRQLDRYKFRRQASIENYIVDFFCPSGKLVIELDGQIHQDPAVAENDMHRDERLKDLGYTVLRFENKDVFNSMEWVLDEIRRHLT